MSCLSPAAQVCRLASRTICCGRRGLFVLRCTACRVQAPMLGATRRTRSIEALLLDACAVPKPASAAPKPGDRPAALVRTESEMERADMLKWSRRGPPCRDCRRSTLLLQAAVGGSGRRRGARRAATAAQVDAAGAAEDGRHGAARRVACARRDAGRDRRLVRVCSWWPFDFARLSVAAGRLKAHMDELRAIADSDVPARATRPATPTTSAAAPGVRAAPTPTQIEIELNELQTKRAIVASTMDNIEHVRPHLVLASVDRGGVGRCAVARQSRRPCSSS